MWGEWVTWVSDEQRLRMDGSQWNQGSHVAD
jgi:hypothetical protein